MKKKHPRYTSTNKRKAAGSQFPFQMLMSWVKCADTGVQTCQCGNPAQYSHEFYTDIFEHQRLHEQGVSPEEATDKIWNQALQEQLQGHYTCYAIVPQCESCAFKYVEMTVGENPALLTFVPFQTLRLGGVVLGNTLKSFDDPGKPFSSYSHATTIDELARAMRSNVVHINVKG